MDTPEPARRASASSPSVQDSPFVNYANSLSPIKLISAGTSAHGDITVPSPQPVFTSPHINLPRKLDLVRRSHVPSVSGSEYFTSRLSDDSTPYMKAAETSGPSVSLPMFQLIPCTQECHNDDPSEDHSSGSHSSCVDEFLVDPVGDINSPAPPSQSPKQATELPQSTQCDDCGANDKTNKTHKENHGEGPRCTSLALVKESMGNPEGSASTVVCDADVNKPNELSQGLQSDSRLLKEANLNFNITKYEQETGSAVCMNLNSSFQAEDGQNRQGPSAPLNLVDTEGCLKVFDNSMRTSDSSVKNKQELGCDSMRHGADTDFPSVQPSGMRDEQLSEHHIALDHPSITSMDSDILDHQKGNSASSFACHISIDAKQQLFQNEKPQESNSTPQLQLEPMQKVIKVKNPLEDAGAKRTRSSDDLDPDEHEDGSQQLRGMRKRLRFEAVETHNFSSGRDKASSTFKSISDEHPPEVPLDFESINFTYAESVATSSNMQETQIVNHAGKALCRLSQCSDKTPEAPAGEVGWAVPVNESPVAAVPRSSGIGLHLNSVGSIGPTNCNSSIQLPGKTMIIKGKKSLHGNIAPLDPQFHSTSASMKVGRSVKLIASSQDPMLCAATEDVDNNMLEKQPMKESNPSVKSKSLLDVKTIRSINHLNFTDCYTSQCDTKKMSENSSMSEESTQTSPRKKRKKVSDSDSSKRCNCKRSKCLKLYCDCFAAGAFCTEDCSCKDCFNRPEHQDVVVGTRQQIESRNPLAFAPKVVIRVNESQKESGENKTITPTAARHKRGCNCKKSLCLKKYCECYQAGVGCSFGCRCEGCQNSFGRKDGFGDINELERKILQKETEYKNSMAGEWEGPSSGEKLENKGARIQTINAKLHHSRLSPLTPLLQGSSENVGFKPQFPSSYYPSPESSASVLPSFTESPSSLGFPVSSSTSTEAREGSLSLVPYNHEPDCHAAYQVDSFSPGWDGFPDICNLSPLPNTSPVALISSASQTRERKVLQTKLFQGSGRLSGGTLRWRSSPITPLPHFHANKFVAEAMSGSGQRSIIEDDTPEILKEAQQPIKETKATSPNQKRVSPPHKLSNEPCSTISPGIKSGRKFILQSVPSFPPLTPYSNSTRQQERQN